MLTDTRSYSGVFPLVRRLARLGCTRFGSPSIFGVITGKRCAARRIKRNLAERKAPNISASPYAPARGPP